MVKRLERQGIVLPGTLQTNAYGEKIVCIQGPDGIILELAEL